MKWAVSFPEESILLVRPCLVAICAGNRPAAKLLSVLLYRHSIRQEHKTDAENINEVRGNDTQDTTFRIYRKQSQLVIDLCNEITEKTLHDVAVPVLQLFGYLDIDESSAIHCYDLHIDVVVNALEAYKQGPKQLEKFLLGSLQLEKFLIDIQLEEFPINKKYFQLALEKVLIANRNSSNNKRGRKPKPEAAQEPQSEDPQINKDYSEIDNKESIVVSAIAENDAPAPINFVERKSDKYKAITKEEIASHSQQAIRNDDDEDISLAETTKHKAMPKQTPAANVQAHSSSSDTAQPATPPSGAVQASVVPKRPRGKVTQATPKSPEELAIDERCRALQQRINEWRGYPLEAKGQIINEYKSIRKLVEKYTDQQIEDIYVYLFTRHWKWSKPDNRYHIGAYVVLSEAQSVLQELKAPTPAQNGKAPTFVIDEERNRRNIEAMKARNAARRLAANG